MSRSALEKCARRCARVEVGLVTVTTHDGREMCPRIVRQPEKAADDGDSRCEEIPRRKAYSCRPQRVSRNKRNAHTRDGVIWYARTRSDVGVKM